MIAGKFRELQLPKEGVVSFTFALRSDGRHGVCLGAAHVDTTRAVLDLVGLGEFDHDKAILVAGSYDLTNHTVSLAGSPEHVRMVKAILNHNGRLVK